MKKLTKSRSNSVIMGVCGGIGEYFNIDPIIIRIIWLISLFPKFFTSAIIYVVCGIIIPDDDGVIYQDNEEDSKDNTNYSNRNSSIFIGGLLVVIGIYFFAIEFFPDIMNIIKLWPVLLIVAGLYIIIKRRD